MVDETSSVHLFDGAQLGRIFEEALKHVRHQFTGVSMGVVQLVCDFLQNGHVCGELAIDDLIHF